MSLSIRVLSDPPRTVPVCEGDTLLSSLLQAGLPFPHSCQQGNCGTCKCELIEGDVLDLPYSEFALSAAERARNVILACRSQIWGDCVIRPLDCDDEAMHPSRIVQCRVATLTDLTHDIKALALAVEAESPVLFTAGQYAKLEFAAGLERDFSMASTPGAALLEFFVRRVSGGSATRYLFDALRVGARVKVSAPFGSAHLRERHAGPILAVAGGSGLAPIKSILESVLTSDIDREVHLYFGARDERDVYLEPLLRQWQERAANLRVHVVLSAPSQASARRVGLVTDAVAQDLRSLNGFKAYLAGPPPMVEAMQNWLLQSGLPRRDIHADAFYTQAEKP
jgi:naphthalene 1,2-dioxygenase ferredoxin reductase component